MSLFSFCCLTTEPVNGEHVCVYKEHPVRRIASDVPTGGHHDEIQSRLPVQREVCRPGHDACFLLWREEKAAASPNQTSSLSTDRLESKDNNDPSLSSSAVVIVIIAQGKAGDALLLHCNSFSCLRIRLQRRRQNVNDMGSRVSPSVLFSPILPPCDR